jgi:AcrR family transcriptional regulator
MVGVIKNANLSLRERRYLRTRQAIAAAALELFTERGFDAVTVADIAERAEIGRSSFFRYFTDKQEVLFDDDTDLHRMVATAIGRAGADCAPPGASLPAALAVIKEAVVALASAAAAKALHQPERLRLIEATPQLRACGIAKDRAYQDTVVRALCDLGTDQSTATLAACLASACYNAGHREAIDEPARLPGAVRVAFDRLERLGTESS